MASDPADLWTEGEEAPRRGQRAFLFVLVACLSIAFLAIGVRLVWIQIFEHPTHVARAQVGLGRTDEIQAYPGDIRTRDGVILARSLLAYDLGLDLDPLLRTQVPGCIRAMADALGMSTFERRARLDSAIEKKIAGRTYVAIAKGVDARAREAVVESLRSELGERLAGRVLVSDAVTRREYPRGSFLAHTVGVGGSSGGQEGIERSRHEWLKPESGRRGVLTDARGEFRFFFPENVEVAPVNGHDVWLTIDVRAQTIVEEELARGLATHRAEAGLAVLMDCNRGDILAMASLPKFDPREYRNYPKAELEKRRKNRVIENVYEPGSVIKPFILATVLEKGLYGRHEHVWKGGRHHRIGGRRVTDTSDHGPIDVEEALVYSSNIGFAIIGMRLGRDGMIDTLDRFGFCRRTGIALPFEVAGSHTSREDWNPVYSTVSVSFGYELLVSPIQLATAFSALINGGRLMQPRIIDRVVESGREVKTPVRVVGRPITEDTSRTMREILARVVDEGTAKYLKMDGFSFGGKTGTADMDPRYTKKDYLSSFEAFAPLESPEVVCLVMIEKSRSGRYYGGSVAGPVVARIFRRWFRIEGEPVFAKNQWEGW